MLHGHMGIDILLIISNTQRPWLHRLLHGPDCFTIIILCISAFVYPDRHTVRLFHSLRPLHLYWSRQPMVFRCLTSLLFTIILTTGHVGMVQTGWFDMTLSRHQMKLYIEVCFVIFVTKTMLMIGHMHRRMLLSFMIPKAYGKSFSRAGVQNFTWIIHAVCVFYG